MGCENVKKWYNINIRLVNKVICYWSGEKQTVTAIWLHCMRGGTTSETLR